MNIKYTIALILGVLNVFVMFIVWVVFVWFCMYVAAWLGFPNPWE